eukprot:165336_1
MFVVIFYALSLLSLWSTNAVITDDFIRYNDLNGEAYNVTYDERSFIINGKRSLLLGGSVHYPRFSPAEWPSIFKKALADGLNHLEIYVFWNIHEPTYDFSGKHVYNYQGRANITQFLEDAKAGGMFINFRIGPYACAEWTFGGLPTWILHDPEVVIRSSNTNWKKYMKTFVDEISTVARPYLAKNGGPIILAQIENEYHGMDRNYVEWCGELAESQAFDIPWVMCNGLSASNTINTCNGNNCYHYAQTHSSKYPGQPLAWTENEGWFQSWGKSYNANATEMDDRSPQDMAQSVAIWFGAGAAHHNYYMWMGGNHVQNFAGSSIANYYADGVNYHADGLAHEPKKTHLMKLHQILAQHQRALLESPIQIGHEQDVIPVGQTTSDGKTFAYRYIASSSDDQLIFLVNLDVQQYILPFNGMKYIVPGNSVSLIDNTGTELYNTGKVSTDGLPTQRVNTVLYSNMVFESYSEPIDIFARRSVRPDKAIVHTGPLEQIRLTNDSFEFLYYSTYISVDTRIKDASWLTFTGQAANAYNVFLDYDEGELYLGQVWNGQHTSQSMSFSLNINLTLAMGEQPLLTVISSSLGIDNYNGVSAGSGPDECDKKGLTGKVVIEDSKRKELLNITDYGWSHYMGLTGEVLRVYGDGMNNVQWWKPAVTIHAMTWYKTSFVTPKQSVLDDGVILIDIGANGTGVNRGHFYVNGFDMGHYNNVVQKGMMVQRFYFVPKDYLKSNGEKNSLVFLDELPPKDLAKIAVVSSTITVP